MTESILERDVDEAGVQSVSWSLEGSHCETCGWNPDEGEFFLWPDGYCYLETRVGCYGGSYDQGRDAVLEQVEFLRNFPGYEHYLNEIEELLNESA